MDSTAAISVRALSGGLTCGGPVSIRQWCVAILPLGVGDTYLRVGSWARNARPPGQRVRATSRKYLVPLAICVMAAPVLGAHLAGLWHPPQSFSLQAMTAGMASSIASLRECAQIASRIAPRASGDCAASSATPGTPPFVGSSRYASGAVIRQMTGAGFRL
jgi:hypothetical protein